MIEIFSLDFVFTQFRFCKLELELELEWSFENIDGVGVEILIRYGVGVAYPRSCPSLVYQLWIEWNNVEIMFVNVLTNHKHLLMKNRDLIDYHLDPIVDCQKYY
jgi:hypothetical protein